MPLVQMEPGAVGELRPPLHPTVWPGAALAPGGAQTLLVGDRWWSRNADVSRRAGKFSTYQC